MRTEFKNYYQILGVSESATTEEIKKVFRQLAIQYHPDRNADNPLCEEKFKEITEAYGVLTDPSKRRKYDLFKKTRGTGNKGDPSGFRYTQDDIFEEMFKNPGARKIFEDLNREFSQSGYRSGPGFFQNTFFNGGSSGLWKLLWLLPGPLGRLGNLLRLLQMAGSAIFFLSRIMNPKTEKGVYENTNPVISGFRNIFKNSDSKNSLKNETNINFTLNITPLEANNGTNKDISYKVNKIPERLTVHIPPGIRSGQILRLKNKGKHYGDKRGDLFLQINVESE